MEIRKNINQFMKHSWAPYAIGVGALSLSALFGYLASCNSGVCSENLTITSVSIGCLGAGLLILKIILDKRLHQSRQVAARKENDNDLLDEDSLENYIIEDRNILQKFRHLDQNAPMHRYLKCANQNGARIIILPRDYKGPLDKISKEGPVKFLCHLTSKELNMTYQELWKNGQEMKVFFKKMRN